MSNELVPFGKYKGQPVETVLADPGYLNWVISQPWMRDRHPRFYQTIINFGGEPQDTPEHNEIQASFLDDERCLRLARLVRTDQPFDLETAAERFDQARQRWDIYEYFANLGLIKIRYKNPKVTNRKFEDQNWDVTFEVDPSWYKVAITALPECSCQPCDHSSCKEHSKCHGGERPTGSAGLAFAFTWDWEHGCEHEDCRSRRTPTTPNNDLYSSMNDPRGHHGNGECLWGNRQYGSEEGAGPAWWLLDHPAKPWINSSDRHWPPHSFWADNPGPIAVECKPILGDDFPTVLRQVLHYPVESRGRRTYTRCVIVRHAEFTSVTWDQVVAMFQASGIILVLEAELAPAASVEDN